MKKRTAKKEKKRVDGRLTANDALLNDFFLGDIVFTLLPIGIIALLRPAFGTLDSSIFLLSEWAFACIILSSLALTRILELKVIHQKDTSWTVVFLSRVCILLIIFSTICLALYTLKDQGVAVKDSFIINSQFILLGSSVILLHLAHSSKEQRVYGRQEFPRNILPRDFHFYLSDNLQVAKSNIRATCVAFDKQYDFFDKNEDIEMLTEYGKKDLEQVIEDMQSDLVTLKERMERWDKPPYSKIAAFETQDDSGL